MSCINCFFSPEYQSKLKLKTHNIERFENRLEAYKNIFLEELKKMVSIDNCDCIYHNVLNLKGISYNRYLNYSNEYLKFLVNNINKIEEFFNLIIDTYYLYIKKSYKHAAENFWKFLKDYNLSNSTSNSIFDEVLFFRARENNGTFDINNAYEYFHIPFSKRYLVGNQRFSIAGQPILYFGSSILTICKELNKKPNELSIAAFIPTYNVIKNINELNRPIFESLVNNLPGIYGTGSDGFEFDAQIALKQIRKSILCEILTFPTKDKGTFIEEYVLPQAYTTLLIEHGYHGIKFPSTKRYSDVKGVHRFCKYNYNYAIFTNYNSESNYDEDLYAQFIPLILNKSSTQVTLNDVEKYELDIKQRNHKMHTKCVSYFVNQKMQIDDLKSAYINGINYFDTQYGSVELKFFEQLYKFTLEYMPIQYEQNLRKNF